MSIPEEKSRWLLLDAICQQYLREVSESGYYDRDSHRQRALRKQTPAYDGEIVLIATADMNLNIRRFIEKVSTPVYSLIHAPEDKQDLFDEMGSIICEGWLDEKIDIADENIKLSSDHAGQSRALVKSLSTLAGKYSAEEISTGLGDPDLLPCLAREMNKHDLPFRDYAGIPVSRTGPYRLLQALKELLSTGSFHDFSNLVRHPDWESFFDRALQTSPGDYYTDLDIYQMRHLQSRIDGALPDDKKTGKNILNFKEEAYRLFADIPEERLSLSAQASLLSALLVKIYGHREFDRFDLFDQITFKSCEKINDVLLELRELEGTAAEQKLNFDDLLACVLASLSDEAIRPESDREAIEILGWLELQLDTAPVLFITGFNEGFIPRSVESDPFLPNTLRKRLGLLDNDRRYARDVYALSAILHSRPHVFISASRTGARGDPILPGRLLYACSDEQLVKRVFSFFCDSDRHELLQTADGQRINEYPLPPRPQPGKKTKDTISATTLRDYIRCPYRFYLKHILGLRALDDTQQELDGAAFGSLAHRVLGHFGKSECRDSLDEDEIFTFLNSKLKNLALREFGKNPLPAVSVQLKQLENRLSAFADKQVEWRQQGWSIKHVEHFRTITFQANALW